MTDQWPRYEVFKQDRLDGPFRNVGSVHAPDAELALMNARDVFARRPSCVALWVVPDAAIVRRTAGELAGEKGGRGEGATEDSVKYTVFSKQSQRQAMTYVDFVGEVIADSPEEAIRRAAETFDEVSGIVWWACPVTAITHSDPNDLTDFEAATSKLFRMPNQYRTVFTMQKIRRAEGGEQ